MHMNACHRAIAVSLRHLSASLPRPVASLQAVSAERSAQYSAGPLAAARQRGCPCRSSCRALHDWGAGTPALASQSAAPCLFHFMPVQQSTCLPLRLRRSCCQLLLAARQLWGPCLMPAACGPPAGPACPPPAARAPPRAGPAAAAPPAHGRAAPAAAARTGKLSPRPLGPP